MEIPESLDADQPNVQALIHWKRQLDVQLVDLRARRDELNEVISRKESQEGNLRELLESEGNNLKQSEEHPQQSNGSLVDSAFHLMKHGGQPLYYKDLAERLLDAGVPISGRNPPASLLSRLVRDTRFQRIGRGTYALAEWGLRSRKRRTPNTRNRTPVGRPRRE